MGHSETGGTRTFRCGRLGDEGSWPAGLSPEDVTETSGMASADIEPEYSGRWSNVSLTVTTGASAQKENK